MDIALLFRPEKNLFDLAIEAPDLQRGQDLETAVQISIFTNRRAEPDDEPELQNRQGWWGDTYADVEGDKIGSRLWLLARAKQTQDTLNAALEYAQECLQWLADDGVALSVEVENEWVGRGVMRLMITIKKPEGDERFDYQYAWDEIKNAI